MPIMISIIQMPVMISIIIRTTLIIKYIVYAITYIIMCIFECFYMFRVCYYGNEFYQGLLINLVTNVSAYNIENKV